MHMLISVCRRCSWNLLTGKRFCWVRSWAAGCPSSPHHRTQLWLGRAACSAPWTSPPSSDSCQRSDPDSFCCSGSIPTARLLRTANSVLSWLTDIIAFLFLSSFFKLYPPSFCDKSGPFHIAFRYVQVQPVIELQSRSHTLLVTCCGLCSCKLAALLWRLNLSGMWNIKAEERCTFAILSCNVSSKVFSVPRHVRGKLPPARFQSPDKLYCDISSPSGSRDEIRGWGK